MKNFLAKLKQVLVTVLKYARQALPAGLALNRGSLSIQWAPLNPEQAYPRFTLTFAFPWPFVQTDKFIFSAQLGLETGLSWVFVRDATATVRRVELLALGFGLGVYYQNLKAGVAKSLTPEEAAAVAQLDTITEYKTTSAPAPDTDSKS